jgi:hypothetical protein
MRPTRVYANLLSSLAIGVTFTRHVARTGALAELTPEELAAYLAPAFRAVLAPAIAAAHAAAAVEPTLASSRGPITPTG